MSSRIRFLLTSRQSVLREFVTKPNERCQTLTDTSTSSQKTPSRRYKSYAAIFPTLKNQESLRVIAAKQDSGIKQPVSRMKVITDLTSIESSANIPESRRCQPRMLKWCSQPEELQQTSTTVGHKNRSVSSGKINKCSQNDTTTSSNLNIKYTSSSTSQSNVTCGSCGGKGHNRKRKSCPNYYTEKESARREVHAERRREKIQEMFLIIIRKANQPSVLKF